MNFFKNIAKKYSIYLDQDQLKMFEIYENFLLSFNSHTNLTRITSHKEIIIKHFLDSLLVNKYIKLKNQIKLIDIGTGAGFPGIPLKILNKNIELTLIESKLKKVKFLKELADKLKIKIKIFNVRAEEINKEFEFFERFDVAIARAVSNMEKLSKFCLPFVKKNRIFIAMKGHDIEEEIKSSKKILKKYGGEFQKIYKYNLPLDYGKRSLIIINKSML